MKNLVAYAGAQNWLSKRLKHVLALLHNSIVSPTTFNPWDSVDQVQIFHTLRLSQYMVSTTTETSPGFMRVTTIILNIDYEYSFIFRLEQLIERQRRVCNLQNLSSETCTMHTI